MLQALCFSVHCPIKISLKIRNLVEEGKINFDEFVDLEQAFEWSENSSAEFSKTLQSEKIKKRFESEVVQNCKSFIDPSTVVANLKA